jgi:5-methylcytosine-specific restriction endonuclease McrA
MLSQIHICAGYRPCLKLRAIIHQRDAETCQDCGATTPPLEVAHRIPWPQGPTTEANLYLLCHSCNGRDRMPWGEDTDWKRYDFPQTKAEFDAIANQVLERVLPV